LFDLQLDRKVTFFDSNPEFLSNDEFMYELRKKINRQALGTGKTRGTVWIKTLLD